MYTVPFREHFPNLVDAFACLDHNDHLAANLVWCAAESVNHYHLRTFELESDIGEDAEYMFCWPDLEKHRAFAIAEIPYAAFNRKDLLILGFRDNLQGVGVDLWPMVRFGFEYGLERFGKLEKNILEDGSEVEDGEDESPDEYESEGIDDGPLAEEEWSDEEEEDDLAVLDDADDADGASDDDDNDSATASGASRGRAIGLTETSGLEAAQFSSPAPVSDSARESDDSASDDGLATASRRSMKRRIVSSSDTEDNSDAAQPAAKRARRGDRRAPIVLADSEDEEDEDQEEGGVPTTAIEIADESQSDSDSEEDEEEEDEEEQDEKQKQARPLSLAERLRIGRQENPVELSDSEDESDAVPSGRRHRRGHALEHHNDHGYGYGEGDDDEEEEDEGDEEEDENDLLDDAAEEEDDEGDEDGREDGW